MDSRLLEIMSLSLLETYDYTVTVKPIYVFKNICIFHVLLAIYSATVQCGKSMLEFSKHRPSGPMLSISRNVRLSVCPSVSLSVCLFVCSLLRYRLAVFLPPLPKIGCQIFLEIRNPWGKVVERSGPTFEHFCLEVV